MTAQIDATAADPATAVTPPTQDGAQETEQQAEKVQRLGDISSRAKGMLGAFGTTYYFAGVGRASEGGLWTKDNPEGYTVLAVAENRLSIDLVQQRLARVAPLPREAFFYDSFQGGQRFRRALANMLTTTFMEGLEIDPSDIFVATGCGAVLNVMSNLLGERGDAVLIPAPYYPGFDFDTQATPGLKAVPVHCAPPGAEASCVPGLAEAAEAVEALGHRVRVVLLCHPNNPIGRSYTPEQLRQMLEWCVDRDIHLISDEVYANSVFGDAGSFTSAAAVARDYIAENPAQRDAVHALLHVVFGVSKDFCASGFRVGAVWTRNKAFIEAASLGGYFHGISSIAQHALSELFEDSTWLSEFVTENRKRLGAAYGAISGALEEAGIPFEAADSTMMLWMDLRQYLPEPTWAGERQLWDKLAGEQRVILTPGECCHASEPGFFRACYAWMDDIDSLPVTVQRIKRCLVE